MLRGWWQARGSRFAFVLLPLVVALIAVGLRTNVSASLPVLAGYVVAVVAGISVFAVRRRRAAYLPPSELPPPPTSLIGRDDELNRLRAFLQVAPGAPSKVAVVSGPPGIGKTALALYAAHLEAARYGGGRLFARLDPEVPNIVEVIRDRFVVALDSPGLAPERTTNPDVLYHRLLAARSAKAPVLIVFDDVVDVESIRTLLPKAPGCVVVMTSRHELSTVDCQLLLRLRQLAPDVPGVGAVGARHTDAISCRLKRLSEDYAATDFPAKLVNVDANWRYREGKGMAGAHSYFWYPESIHLLLSLAALAR